MNFKINNPIANCGLKFDSSDTGEFEGYASVFDGVDAVKDTILKGAYSKTLGQKRAPSMFVNHDSWQVPVGDWVKLEEDDVGLLVKGKIDLNHKEGPTVYSALKRGAMDALSIGFRIPAGGAEEKEDGTRVISEIDLKEISIVNFPADDAARISIVKSEIETIENLKEAEMFLRDSGVFSKSAAMAFVSRIKKLTRSDSGVSFQNEITMLEKRLNTRNATDSLLNTLNRL